MRVVYVSSEIAPFAKTGGLADVAGALPCYIKSGGFDIITIMPLYGGMNRENLHDENLELSISHGTGTVYAAVMSSVMPGSDAKIYFIDCPLFYGRPGIYGEEGRDYTDNDSRFSFFCMAVFEACRGLNFRPDVIHCNDWQTGLVPVYLREKYRADPFFSATRVLFTIHNIAYAGLFDPATAIGNSGLSWSVFSMYGVEFNGRFSFLKGGIYYSHLLNTVSPGYSMEIQSVEYGEGLHGLLRARCGSLSGIINGLDYKVWDPSTDPLITRNYDADSLGKRWANREELIRQCGFDFGRDAPVIGMVTRLTAQKGVDITAEIIDALMKRGIGFVMLGSGEEYYQDLFRELAFKYPGRVSVFLRYDEALAHLIYAGIDMFLMPSRFEPCGISQLISMRYGALPVVRETGGLADTVIPFYPADGVNSLSNGFSFTEFSASALLGCVDAALDVYRDRSVWHALMKNAMKADFSWAASSLKYQALYRKLVEDKA